MATKQEQLKEKQEAARKAREEAKAIKAELEAGKEERKAARKAQAQARKDVRTHKAAVRELSAEIYPTFSKGDADAITELADKLSDAGAELAKAVRAFGEAEAELEEL